MYLVPVDACLLPPTSSSCVVAVITNSIFSLISNNNLCLKKSIPTVSASWTVLIEGGEVIKSG